MPAYPPTARMWCPYAHSQIATLTGLSGIVRYRPTLGNSIRCSIASELGYVGHMLDVPRISCPICEFEEVERTFLLSPVSPFVATTFSAFWWTKLFNLEGE